MCQHENGVATCSRLLQFIGLISKRALRKRRYSAKVAYNFKEPTNRRHPIVCCDADVKHTHTDVCQHVLLCCSVLQWRSVRSSLCGLDGFVVHLNRCSRVLQCAIACCSLARTLSFSESVSIDRWDRRGEGIVTSIALCEKDVVTHSMRKM